MVTQFLLVRFGRFSEKVTSLCCIASESGYYGQHLFSLFMYLDLLYLSMVSTAIQKPYFRLVIQNLSFIDDSKKPRFSFLDLWLLLCCNNETAGAKTTTVSTVGGKTLNIKLAIHRKSFKGNLYLELSQLMPVFLVFRPVFQ